MGALNANKGVGPGAEGTTKPRPLKTLSFSDNKTDSEEDKPEKDYLAQLPDTFGRISLENAETSYVGSAHWIAILDGVCPLLRHTLIMYLLASIMKLIFGGTRLQNLKTTSKIAVASIKIVP